MKLRTFHIGGIHPDEHKLTNGLAAVEPPLPQTAVFLLQQHIGAPAKAVVKRGDRVKAGTLLAEAGGYVSAPVYSSVSGTVKKVDTAVDATGCRVPAVYVDVEGDEWEESVDRSVRVEHLADHPELTPEEIVNRVRWAGITGMGGAGFPTHVKLTPPPTAKAECVIINGVECEPYITSDYRLMIEHTDEIIEGIALLMRAAKVDRAYIGIEENKPEAIRLFQEKCRAAGNVSPSRQGNGDGSPAITVVPLKQKYPQGGEKQLVEAVLGRQVPPPPALPVDAGAIVQNVGTAFAVYEAVMKHKPLVERYTTVTGLRLKRPGNFRVRIGTPFRELIDHCGGLPEGMNKVLAGGPMMGRSVETLDVPVCKGTNAITVLSGTDACRKAVEPCIRCAKCAFACPMGLEPWLLAQLTAAKNWERLEREQVVSCISCGSCQYSCPAHRPILDNIVVGKATVMALIKNRNKK